MTWSANNRTYILVISIFIRVTSSCYFMCNWLRAIANLGLINQLLGNDLMIVIFNKGIHTDTILEYYAIAVDFWKWLARHDCSFSVSHQ